MPGPPRRAARRPLFEWNDASIPGSSRFSSHKTCALARVAWPHRSTSTVGVNQRMSKPPSSGTRKAVSATFISAATSCIHSSGFGSGRRHTPAGFPWNGRSVKASTWKSGMDTGPPGSWRDDDSRGAGSGHKGEVGGCSSFDPRRQRTSKLPPLGRGDSRPGLPYYSGAVRYPFVLFDVGETLLAPRDSFATVYARVLAELGLVRSPDVFEMALRA